MALSATIKPKGIAARTTLSNNSAALTIRMVEHITIQKSFMPVYFDSEVSLSILKFFFPVILLELVQKDNKKAGDNKSQ